MLRDMVEELATMLAIAGFVAMILVWAIAVQGG